MFKQSELTSRKLTSRKLTSREGNRADGAGNVLLSFGSNLGERHQTLDGAWHALGQTANIQAVRLSSFYETEPVGGPAGQPKYLNAAGIIHTTLSPEELLVVMQKIESDFGRVRAERWGARTLDIDILLYANRIVELPSLTIPHPEMLHRQFVLEPAQEIADDWVHPLTRKTIGEHYGIIKLSGSFTTKEIRS